MIINSQQIRAARALVDMSQRELAAKAGIATATLNNIERGAQTDPKISTLTAIQQTLEKEGVEFVALPSGSVGVAIRPPKLSAGNATILIVDDNRGDRVLYRTWLHKAPDRQYTVIEAENAKAGLDAFLEHHPDCLILDFMMYGTDGFQLMATLRKENAALPPIIFITSMHNEIMEESARAQGVHAYLNKQYLIKEDLYAAIDSALAL